MRRLSSQIFVGQVAILAATVLVGFALFADKERAQLDQEYEQRAGVIAQTVASIPQIQVAMQSGDDHGIVQSIAQQVRAETGANYVVVLDLHGVRHSHPDPSLIGVATGDPIIPSGGATQYWIDNGSMGRSASGKTPLYGPDGKLAGEVSVGIEEQTTVTSAWWHQLGLVAEWLGLALAFGAAASWLLARRLKRRTFGLELDEIAKLLQEREALLHGIREGMIAFDRAGRVTMVNDEARRLIGLSPHEGVGGRLADLVPEGRLRDVLSGEVLGQDEIVLTEEYCLTVNHMPVSLGGRPHGAVVTLRDRTELSGLLRELDSVRGLTDALRAQQHEFSNRMHVVAGLLELGEADEAMRFLSDLSGAEAEFAESVRSRIASPLIVGLILAKAAVAGERGIHLELSEDSWLGEAPDKVQALTTILGNLIDNAFDAVSGPGAASGGQGRVLVALVQDEDGITVRVADNGPGIPHGAAESVFTDGFTTKPDDGTLRHGLGLALVRRLVQRLGGQITASEGAGAVFTVRLSTERLAACELAEVSAP